MLRALAATGGVITSIGVCALAPSGVTAGSYGSTTAVPVITIDTYGRATSAGTAALTKASVGLGNVDNTSDANKPVSTAQAAANTAVQSAAASDATTKANAAQAYAIQRSNHTGTQLSSTISDFGTAAAAAAPVQSVAGKTGAVALVKGDVGLGNVDNTSDANKPVSTAQAAAISAAQAAAASDATSKANAAAAAAANASNLTSGTVAAARGGAGTVSGILKADGAGNVSAAAAGTDFLAPAGNASQATVTPTGGITANSLAAWLAKIAPSATTVATRPPLMTDDSTSGYTTSSLWNYNGTQYAAARVTAGNAAWIINDATTTLPCDFLTPVAGCYGARRLKASYGTGAAFDVQFTSGGAVTTINYLANGLPDYASLDAASAAAGLPPRIVKWYDQSGVGANATAAFANAPTMTPTITCGNSRAIVFDSVINGGTQTQVYLTLPATMTVNQNSHTAAEFVGAFTNIRPTGFYQVGPSSGGSNTWTMAANTSFFSSPQARLVINTVSGLGPIINGSVSSNFEYLGHTSGTAAGGVYTRYGEFNQFQTSTPGSSTLIGGYIGAIAPSGSIIGPGYSMSCGFAVFGVSASAATTASLRASFHQVFGTVPQAKSVVVATGDSIMEGFGNTYLRNQITYTAKNAYPNRLYYNTAVFGSTLSQQNGFYISNGRPVLSGNTAKVRIAIIEGGTNDLISGTDSGATVYARTQTLASSICADNPTHIIVNTILPRSGLTGNTNYNDYNTLVRNGYQSLCPTAKMILNDVAADPTMQATGDTTLYIDGTHPTSLGYNYIGQLNANLINAIGAD